MTLPNGPNHSSQPSERPLAPGSRRARYVGAVALVAFFGLVPFVSPVAAQGCVEPDMNVQCTEFGAIKMPARRDIKGEPVDITATVILNTNFQDHGARWVMFSVRNVTEDGDSPVSIRIVRFYTANGDIQTQKVDNPKASEIDMWVDTLDLPVGTPITIDMQVGASDRGAFSLEVLVLAFDRGYSPVKDSAGNDASLFSFTLLGVNKETGDVSGGGGSGGIRAGKKLPSVAFPVVLAALFVVQSFVGRRRK